MGILIYRQKIVTIKFLHNGVVFNTLYDLNRKISIQLLRLGTKAVLFIVLFG